MRQSHRTALAPLLLGTLLVVLPPSASADGGVTFTDVAASAGITYERAPSPDRVAARQAFLDRLPFPISEFSRADYPMKHRGAPGVVLFDYDGDGDVDIYATNGPGVPNSLLANQLRETGAVSFVDVGVAAGVGATSQDSSGACAGDIDNDGDVDLYVLAIGHLNQLFENNGDGTFTDITTSAGVGGDGRHANACSFGDVDNDGLLDIVVANSYDDWTHRKASSLPDTYPGLEHNYLFVNQGGNVFSDESASSGIENVSNMSGPGLTGAGFSWAIAMVDVDLDGDVDILSADNQGIRARDESERRGWNRLFENDGNGNFTDVTRSVGLDVDGGWMGLSFADMNCDGNLDFFSTNTGTYVTGLQSTLYERGDDGTYTAADMPLNVFGWGTSAFDYDNDGDSDVLYHGSMDIVNFIVGDNDGLLIRNDGVCSGEYSFDLDAWANTDHTVRETHGVAVGDLDDDGFTDIVTASAFNVIPGPRWIPMIFVTGESGSPIDGPARLGVYLTTRSVPGHFALAEPVLELPDGTLTVEINSGDNGNGWAKFDLRGSVGTLATGEVNRDGIGAVVRFTPDGGPTSMLPVLGGSSYASQDDNTLTFGLGSAAQGTVEVLWPGGVRNRLHDVAAGERLLLPEIPCSFDGDFGNRGLYASCVATALDALVGSGVIDEAFKDRLLVSALRAFDEQ